MSGDKAAPDGLNVGFPMTHHVAKHAAMMAGWEDLRRELDAWGETGAAARFWWRDDDAVAATAALDRLLGLADGLPLALAVIPAQLEASLAAAVSRDPGAAILQHGWSHANHAAPGAKKVELGIDRPGREVLRELRAGLRRLAGQFGERFLPILVPPWNRVAPELLHELPGAGFVGASAYGRRAAPRDAAGLRWANVHVDIVAWEAGAFAGTARVLGAIVRELAARRGGHGERDEPIGIMSHHLVHGEAAETFLERLFAELRGHSAARILSPAEVFAG
jgi:hypothetical protein